MIRPCVDIELSVREGVQFVCLSFRTGHFLDFFHVGYLILKCVKYIKKMFKN